MANFTRYGNGSMNDISSMAGELKMSTRKERFTKHLEAVDSYIKHQMSRRTEAEKQAFRTKQIAMYDDKLERYAEKLRMSIDYTKGYPRALSAGVHTK